MSRTIFAFNGDLESRLALHWLVHERGHEVITVSLNLGQGVYLEPLGELALELGATAAQVIDRRELFLRDFALPTLQAGAVYQVELLPRLRPGPLRHRPGVGARRPRGGLHPGGPQCRQQGQRPGAHGGGHRRPGSADLEVLAPVRQWNLRTLEDKLNYARKRRLPIEEPAGRPVTIDRNLWGDQHLPRTTWATPGKSRRPTFSRSPVPPEQAPDEAESSSPLGFEAGLPASLNGNRLDPLTLVRESEPASAANTPSAAATWSRIACSASRAASSTRRPRRPSCSTAHRDLESLVQSRELLQLQEFLSRRYAELVYSGLWFHDLRRSSARLFRADAALRHRRGPPETVQGLLPGDRPAQPAQPVRQPTGEPDQHGMVRQPVGAGVYLAVDLTRPPGGPPAGG